MANMCTTGIWYQGSVVSACFADPATIVDALYASARKGTEVRIPSKSFCQALNMSEYPA